MRHASFSLLIASSLLLGGMALAQTVVIVKNSAHPRYEEPLQVIRVRLGEDFTVRQLDLTDMDLAVAERSARALMQSQPVAVVALGDKATYLANRAMAPARVWFGMVSGWRDLKLDTARVAGVSMRLTPENLMSQVQMFLPKTRRVGVIYSGASQAFVEAAMLKAASLRMTLIPIYIETAEEFPQIFEAIAGTIDAYWLVEDPTIATKDNLRVLIDVATTRRLPTISYSEGLVEAGLTMAITADGEAVGGQIADQVLALAKGQARPPSVEPPAKARITFNRAHLRDFELEVDPMLLSFARLVTPADASKRP